MTRRFIADQIEAEQRRREMLDSLFPWAELPALGITEPNHR
jgi:hypothetical protein